MTEFDYNVGLSTAFDLTEENFKKLRDAGISAIEISVPAEKYAGIDYAGVKKFADEYGIKLWSYHLPFYPFEKIDISALDEEQRKYTLSYFSEIIEKATAIGFDKVVVHASGEPIEECKREKRMSQAKKSLAFLAEFAGKRGAVIAVEDLPRTCLGRNSSDIKELLSADKRLKVCFDTNHLLGEDNLDFMEELKDKIITVHISDYDRVNERHWLPGEGVIDWQEMLKKFREIGYKGVWMYEISLKCPKTIIRDRDLDFVDFRANADNIFANKPQPVLSRHKPDLGMWE